MKAELLNENGQKCSGKFIMALTDTLNVITGKWKLHIIGSLVSGKKRFKEIETILPNINPRMLSKELKDLEANGMLTRSVYNTTPVSVEYELTSSGYAFCKVLDVMVEWGLEHRETTVGQSHLNVKSLIS